MKIKFPVLLFTLIFLFAFYTSAQNKVERQHRIKKSQFPNEALSAIAKSVQDIKRLKFYREVDTATSTYTAKFKKTRLFYEMAFNKEGELKTIAFKVKQVDIPTESFQRITNYHLQHFEKSKIQKMLQSYPLEGEGNDQNAIKVAFQNLMVPKMFYTLLVRGKNEGKSADYIVKFDAEGNFKEMKKSLPANYDRVLY